MMDDTQAELNQERKQNILHKFLPENESYFLWRSSFGGILPFSHNKRT